LSFRALNFVAVVPDARSHRRLFWQLQIGGWLLMVTIATGFVSLVFNDWTNIALTGVGRQIFAFFLTLGLWRYYRRWPAETFKLAPHALQIALACLTVTVLEGMLVEAIRRAFDLPSVPLLAQRGALPSRLSLYLAWTSLYFMIRQELAARDRGLRLAHAETAAREAELATLRAQVNPHFLFNALTSILAECDDNNLRSAGAITRSLADYLRASLLQRTHHAPLGEEVDAIAGYLRVEQARFEGRLIHTFAIDDAARAAVVPTTVLLPLVENAVKYGMRTSPPPLRVAIAATLRDGRMTITVENSGRWLDPRPGASDSTQIGLANLRRRLSLLHGDEASLTIDHDAQHVRVTVSLPTLTTGAVTSPSSRQRALVGNDEAAARR
jgi:hypothetical protein